MDIIDLFLVLLLALIAGTAASQPIGGRRDTIFNTLVGIVGSFIGPVLFRFFDLKLPASLNRGITLGKVLIAFVGALVTLVIVRGLRQ
jgi:uncharacterized membrane protein YeaQ/YmgE (transglycosylase-associated protein family)